MLRSPRVLARAAVTKHHPLGDLHSTDLIPQSWRRGGWHPAAAVWETRFLGHRWPLSRCVLVVEGEGAGWGLFSKGAAPTHTGSPLMAQPTPKPSLPTAIMWRKDMALEGTQMVRSEHQLHAQPPLVSLLEPWHPWGCCLLDFFLPTSPAL